MFTLARKSLYCAWESWRSVGRNMREAPRNDVLVLLTRFGLTVLINMEIAAMLFIKRMVELTEVQLSLASDHHRHTSGCWMIFSTTSVVSQR